jgi:hypothetical protein
MTHDEDDRGREVACRSSALCGLKEAARMPSEARPDSTAFRRARDDLALSLGDVLTTAKQHGKPGRAQIGDHAPLHLLALGLGEDVLEARGERVDAVTAQGALRQARLSLLPDEGRAAFEPHQGAMPLFEKAVGAA